MVDFIGKRFTINPAQDALPPNGIAEVLSGLAKPFMDTLTPALKQQKLDDMAREAQNVIGYQNMTAAAKAAGTQLDPYDIAKFGVGAGMDPKNAFGYGLGVSAVTRGARAPGTSDYGVAAGHPISATASGQDAALANARTLQGMQEATKGRLAADLPETVFDANGVPTLVRRADAYGKPAAVPLGTVQGGLATKLLGQPGGVEAAPPASQHMVGGYVQDKGQNWADFDPQTGALIGRGRTMDQKTDASTGQPLSPTAQLVSPLNAAGSGAFAVPGQPGTADKTALNNSIRNAQTVEEIGKQIIAKVTANPSIVGPAGNIQRGAQDAADAINGVVGLFGGKQQYDQAVAQARDSVLRQYGPAAAKLIPQLFNPDLNSVQVLSGLLVYHAAASVGQNGRDVSDKDVARFQAMAGNPDSWFTGDRTFVNKIQTLMGETARQRAINEDYLRRNNVMAAPGGQAPAATAAPARVPQEGDTASGPSGRIILRGGQWTPLQ